MAYAISEFGNFELYVPDVFPEGAPSSALFCRRVSDQRDWYSMARGPSPFADGAVIATAFATSDPDVFVVGAVLWATDREMMFPAGALLLQIMGVDPTVEKPHKLFEQQLYSRSAATITPQPPPVLHLLSKKVLWDRMTTTEAEQFDADLLEAPSKLRRTFDAATVLDDRDDLWPALRDALLVRVTSARADQLLQRTD